MPWHSCVSPRSDSCSENFVINNQLSGPLRGSFTARLFFEVKTHRCARTDLLLKVIIKFLRQLFSWHKVRPLRNRPSTAVIPRLHEAGYFDRDLPILHFQGSLGRIFAGPRRRRESIGDRADDKFLIASQQSSHVNARRSCSGRYARSSRAPARLAMAQVSALAARLKPPRRGCRSPGRDLAASKRADAARKRPFA